MSRSGLVQAGKRLEGNLSLPTVAASALMPMQHV